MASAIGIGLLSGVGQGIADVGKIMAQDQMEQLRQERASKLQGNRDAALFEQKKALGVLEQKDKIDLQKMKDQSAKDVAGIRVKKGSSASGQKKYESALSDYIKLYGKEPDQATKSILYNNAHGLSKTVKTRSGAEKVVGVGGKGAQELYSVGRGEGQTRLEGMRDPQVIMPPSDGNGLLNEPKNNDAPPNPADYSMLSQKADGANRTLPNGYRVYNGRIFKPKVK